MSAGPRYVTDHPIPSFARSTTIDTKHLHRYEYLWEDGVRYKKPTKLPAPEYVDALMNWAQGLLDNEDVFPNKIGNAHSRLGSSGGIGLIMSSLHRRPVPEELQRNDTYIIPSVVQGICTLVQQSL